MGICKEFGILYSNTCEFNRNIDGNNDFSSNKSMYLQEITPLKYIYNLYEPVNKLKNTIFPLTVPTKLYAHKTKTAFKNHLKVANSKIN